MLLFVVQGRGQRLLDGIRFRYLRLEGGRDGFVGGLDRQFLLLAVGFGCVAHGEISTPGATFPSLGGGVGAQT